MFESASSCRSSSSSSSTRHRSCYCLWKVALVTLVAFMANVCDIVRALQEQQAESRGRLLLVNDESTAIITAASASSAAAVGEDGDEGEDKEGDGPNTRIAKTVEVRHVCVCVRRVYCPYKMFYTCELQNITYNNTNTCICKFKFKSAAAYGRFYIDVGFDISRRLAYCNNNNNTTP